MPLIMEGGHASYYGRGPCLLLLKGGRGGEGQKCTIPRKGSGWTFCMPVSSSSVLQYTSFAFTLAGVC